jgi:RNA polymerase sigma-70 factor (ECF subfamily)
MRLATEGGMAAVQLDSVMRHVRRSVRPDTADRTDGQLLACFIDQRDEAAFEALVRRHGPMVYGVCHRAVGNHHDAEDAFQAAFLVLARKASSIRPRERLASWLHGVALRTALKAKAMTAKRRLREKQVMEMPEPEATQQGHWRDLQPLLDQELNGLPENYRLPILLCDLEGKTIKEATRQLGWPQGTLAGRLARGRKLLAKRLANRGVMLPVGLLVAVVAQNASAGVPASLLRSAAMIASGQAMVPAKVLALMEGVMKAMLMSKLKAVIAIVLALGIVATGATNFTFRTAAAQSENTEVQRGNSVITGTETNQKLKTGNNASGEPDARTDKELLQGVWRVTSLMIDGKEVPKDEMERTVVEIVFTADTALVYNASGIKTKGSYGIHPDQKPKALDVSPPNGKTVQLIYNLEGNSLIIAESGDSRPRDFSGKDTAVAVLKRVIGAEAKQNATAEKDKNASERNRPPVPATPKVSPQREYVITSRLLEASANQPNEVVRFPRVTLEDGQLVPVHITEGPQNLLSKVVEDEKIKIGTFLDVRVRRLGGKKVRLFCAVQRNEIEKSSVDEIRVLGNTVQVIQDVELHKPTKIVLQKSPRRWVEVTVDEMVIDDPVAPASTKAEPEQK